MYTHAKQTHTSSFGFLSELLFGCFQEIRGKMVALYKVMTDCHYLCLSLASCLLSVVMLVCFDVAINKNRAMVGQEKHLELSLISHS